MKKLLSVLFVGLLALAGCKVENTPDPAAKRALEEQKAQEAAAKAASDSLMRAQKAEADSLAQFTFFVDSVQKNEGLFHIMQRMNISGEERRILVNAIQDSIDVGSLRVGQLFYAAKDSNNSVVSFSFPVNRVCEYVLTRKDTGYVYTKIEKPVVRRQSIYEGELEPGSSLDGMLYKVGIPQRMRGVVSGVLQCKVAFNRAQPKDRFRILLEETFDQDSNWISGKVLYAEFDGRTLGHHEAFLYYDGDPKSSFNAHYTENGEALIFNGLRYPLDKMNVGSRFGNRLHPILGIYKMHNGVDLRAGMGQPIYAVADGIVVKSTYDDASGNYVSIKHADGYISYYMHMSARGVSAGAHVSARQFIGKVGSTGRSTGPHLHFGFKNPQGKWIDPLSKTMIATPKLSGERLANLKKQIADIRHQISITEESPAVKVRDSSDVMVRMRSLK